MSENAGEMTRLRIGLCADCRFMQAIRSDRSSTFYQCQLSATDSNFPKYPRLPVLRCMGYDPSTADRGHPVK